MRSGRESVNADVDQHAGQIVAAKSEPLAVETDDARASRPDHLDPSAVVQPHLAEPMHQLDVTHHVADARRLTRREQ